MKTTIFIGILLIAASLTFHYHWTYDDFQWYDVELISKIETFGYDNSNYSNYPRFVFVARVESNGFVVERNMELKDFVQYESGDRFKLLLKPADVDKDTCKTLLGNFFWLLIPLGVLLIILALVIRYMPEPSDSFLSVLLWVVI